MCVLGTHALKVLEDDPLISPKTAILDLYFDVLYKKEGGKTLPRFVIRNVTLKEKSSDMPVATPTGVFNRDKEDAHVVMAIGKFLQLLASSIN